MQINQGAGSWTLMIVQQAVSSGCFDQCIVAAPLGKKPHSAENRRFSQRCAPVLRLR